MENVGKNKFVIVKFYTKWCRYCRLFSPIYEKFYKKIKKKRKDILIARLEGEENEEISYEYGIRSYPKVAIFYPGSLEIKAFFTQSRTLENLMAWVEEHAPLNLKNKDDQKLKLLTDEDEVKMNYTELELIGEEYTPNKIDTSSDVLSNSTNFNSTSQDKKQNLEKLRNLLNTTKTRFEKLNQDFLLLKTQISSIKSIPMETEHPNMSPNLFSNYENFDYVVLILIIFLCIFSFFLVKKVYNKIVN